MELTSMSTSNRSEQRRCWCACIVVVDVLISLLVIIVPLDDSHTCDIVAREEEQGRWGRKSRHRGRSVSGWQRWGKELREGGGHDTGWGEEKVQGQDGQSVWGCWLCAIMSSLHGMPHEQKWQRMRLNFSPVAFVQEIFVRVVIGEVVFLIMPNS